MKIPAAHVALGVAAVLLLAGASSSQALPGVGSVDSGDIKDGQVKRVDVAANAINSAKVASNTLTGADIAESTLGARFARTYTAIGATPLTKVAAAGGFEVWAGCTEDVDVIDHYANIRIKSTVDGASLSLLTVIGSTSSTDFVAGFDAGDDMPLGGTLVPGHTDLLFSTPSGKVVEAHIAWAGLTDVPQNTCVLHGVVIG